MGKFTSALFLAVLTPFLVFAQSADQPAPSRATSSVQGSAQLSTADLQRQIQDLLKQLQALQAEVAALQGELGATAQASSTVSTSTPEVQPAALEAVPPELTRFLSRGSSGDDVRNLQEFLAKDKDVYPDGLVTGYFGPLTEAAVKRWQKKHGIESVGVIGPKTMTKFQEMGKGKVQELIQEGAGQSGMIPQGLLTSPGIQSRLGISATTTQQATTTSTAVTTTTPSGTTPAVPATPAQPSTGSGGSPSSTPATPAIPAVPATPTSTTATSSDTVTPSTPTGLTAAPISSSQINLSWVASTDNVGVAGYKIFRNNSYAASSMSTYYYDYSVSSLPTYSYYVQAYDAAGNMSSSSVTVSATAINGTISSSTPSAPTNLTYFLTNSNATVNLSWTDNSTNETSFAIYRQYGGVWTYLTQTNANVTAFSDTPTAGTYSYKVSACNSVGCSLTPITPTIAVSSGIVDTSLPSMPTGLSATAVSSSQINLSWSASTDNVGVTGYRIYRGGTQIGATTDISYSDTGLAAATAYSYTVAAYDAAGNVSNQSAPASAATLSAGPSAPTNVQAVTTSGSQSQPPEMWYYLTFNYTLQSATQSFNVYRKKPTDASFVKYTYNAQTTVNSSILPLPGSNASNLYHRDVNKWEWWTTLTGLSPDTVQGEYKFYVTAVDANGVESALSETKSFKLYAAPAITSPADGSTISAPFTITVTGDPNAPSPTYGMALYKRTTGDTAWSAWPAPSTSFTYSGQALNPSDNPHRLVVWFSSGAYDRSLFSASIFNIENPATSSTTASTSTSAASSKIFLASILASLSEVLSALQQLVR